MFYITYPGFILSLSFHSRHLHKRRYGALGGNKRSISQESPNGWQDSWVCVDSDERWGLETQCCKLHVNRVRQAIGLSEAWWGPEHWESPWLPKAPVNCCQGTLAIQTFMGNMFSSVFHVPLYRGQTKQAYQSVVVYGLFVLWGQDCKISLWVWLAFWCHPGWTVICSKLMDPARVTILRRWLGLD